MILQERPILFSGPMVRAILDGRKTQTRRVCKLQPEIVDVEPRYEKNTWGFWHDDEYPNGRCVTCPYGVPGGRLWVRETWRQYHPKTSYSDGIVYRADAQKALGAGSHSDTYQWKPSIHMPRKFCRLLLDVKAIRVERLQDISEDDADAEGVDAVSMDDMPRQAVWSRRQDFAQLWDSLNKKRGFGWDTNPWVWIIKFERVQTRRAPDE